MELPAATDAVAVWARYVGVAIIIAFVQFDLTGLTKFTYIFHTQARVAEGADGRLDRRITASQTRAGLTLSTAAQPSFRTIDCKTCAHNVAKCAASFSALLFLIYKSALRLRGSILPSTWKIQTRTKLRSTVFAAACPTTETVG